jgi:polar amino acid transport system substrate-binding protein
MKFCRLPVAVVCLLTVSLTAGWMIRAVQAAPLNQAHPDATKIRVGIKTLEPFVFIDEDGQPSGFSIDLWNAIAADLGIQYEWVTAATVNELITDLRSGKIDVAIAGISMTPEREALVDFTYPYFESGLQILVPENPEPGGVSLTNIFFSSIVFKVLGVGMVLLFIMANMIWLMERRSNPGMPKSYAAGVWDGLWWGLNMLLKQEYLDQAKPDSFLKRLFAMACMVAGIVLIAEFTAAITASQTVSQLRPTIEGLPDLQGRRVLTVAGSTADDFLLTQEIRHTTTGTINAAYDALLNDEADAIVFDAPVLLFYSQNQGYGLVRVVGPVFQEENYGIALPTGSPLREPINAALLRLKSSGRYDKIHEKWFGTTN